MKLEDIRVGMKVVAIDESYKGLEGVITDIKHGDQKETENETVCDIYVDFNESFDMLVTHPQLNGTTVSQVIMGDDELAYFQDENDELPITLEGQYVCLGCFHPITSVTETQTDCYRWDWEQGQYVKGDDGAESWGKKCGTCGYHITDDSQSMFPY